jgi:4-amino-4-deoxy-L-arabinose transferase-like glycosyltransferase
MLSSITRMNEVRATSHADANATEVSVPRRTAWPYFAAAAVIVVVVAGIRWSFAHPYGVTWDEAGYINEILIDGQRLRTGHVLRLAGRILARSLGRPPAYRLLALPFVGVFGYHTTEVRLVSLACFCLSVLLIYLTARRLSNSSSGALAALIFALSPEVVSASIFYGTDTQLYLGTAGMLYFLFDYWNKGVASTRNWIGLGLAISLGLLSKTSFFAIFVPLVVFWLFASVWQRLRVPGLLPQFKAFALALAVSGPWWALNFKSAFAYGAFARGFVRNSLGPPSLITWARWLKTVFECLLGHGIGVLIVGVLAASLFQLFVRRKLVLDRLQTAAIGACLCAALPIVAVQLSGTNDSLRHISPIVIPLAIVVGILADRSGWMASGAARAFSAVLICVQLAMLMAPVVHPNKEPVSIGFVNGFLPWRVLSRTEQWDWSPVRTLGNSCGVEMPRISYLGSGRALNPASIQYPWVAYATSTRTVRSDIPDVEWLWRFEDGSFDWPAIMNRAAQSDLVITAPYYAGELLERDDLDNQYNAEFEQNLSRDPLFQGPYHFQMGRFKPVDVDVFVKKSLVCPSEGLQ